MALTTAQYRTMRDLFRGALSVEFANPSDATVLSFFNQLLSEAATTTPLSMPRQFLAGEIARRILSGNFSDPSDANVVDFWTALTSDANASSAMGTTAQYQTMKKALVGAFQCEFFNPSAADILGYFQPYAGSLNLATLFPGAYLVVQSDLGLTYGGTMLAGGTSNTIVATLTGTLSGKPVPILIKCNTIGTIGVDALFDVYFDGGTAASMVGVLPSAGVPFALTGAGVGLSVSLSAGSPVSTDNTWKATCSALADQSGNGFHMAQATASRQPIVAVGANGKAALGFDGIDDFLFNTPFSRPAPATTPFSFYLVMSPLAKGGQQIWVGSNVSATLYSDTGALNRTIQYCSAVGNISTVLTATPTRIRATYTGSTSDLLKVGAAADVTGASASNALVNGMSIGAGSLAGAFPATMPQFFAFVICPPMSAAQLAAVDSALNSLGGYGPGSVVV